jgi:calpain-15
MRNPPLELQKKFLKDQLLDLERVITASNRNLHQFPYQVSSIEDLDNFLRKSKLNFVDIDFPPMDKSVYDPAMEPPFDSLIHWRRPKNFMEKDESLGLYDPNVFYDSIEPNDIRQGALGDCWFMCALASLAERPALVERLFITKEAQENGVYRIKLCKNGEWVTVTIDDYFPCYPEGGPIFSRAHGNELWVLLLEKAYAKLHGNYFLLRGGYANEGMIDLTGCPSVSYDFKDDYVEALISNGEFWRLMKHFDEEGYLISASTPGEDRWTEIGGPDQEGGLVPGHAYSVIIVKEALNHKLMNIRNPWGNFEWDGDWSDKSSLWTREMKELINPVLDENDGTFWMSFGDFVKHFRSLNVCRVKNWEEVRIKGKFIRV